MKRGITRLGQLVAWLVIVAVAAVLVAAVVVPRLADATPYTVLTSSMEPDLSPGTLVVVRSVPVDDIGIGDVITYQLESGKAPVVTHRVVGVAHDERGEPLFRTRGDANSVPDEGWVRPAQVRGEVWYSVPHLGRLNTLLSGQERQLTVYVVAGGLAMYAGAMFAGSLRDRHRATVTEKRQAAQTCGV